MQQVGPESQLLDDAGAVSEPRGEEQGLSLPVLEPVTAREWVDEGCGRVQGPAICF